jgi:hypothetical protein
MLFSRPSDLPIAQFHHIVHVADGMDDVHFFFGLIETQQDLKIPPIIPSPESRSRLFFRGI